MEAGRGNPGELWDWFRSLGTAEPLAAIAEDLAGLAG